jgi:D-alanyl-lipoteichoic acid acyltransferase DltB (MBOAT superfamily)
MLFNSIPFLFYFFPLTVVVFFILGRRSQILAGIWLAAASLFFYGWWNVIYIWLLVASVIVNYSAGYLISREATKPGKNFSRTLLTLAVIANLLLLGYFKYAGFFAETANGLFGTKLSFGHIILPLGISFFTFTQIAFLVDAYQGKAKEFNFIHYLLFVTYFPHLISGPILHHSQIMPQFGERKTYKLNWENTSAGLTILAIGLGKKVFIADSFSKIAIPVFYAAQQGLAPRLLEAWTGALAYTLKLYFDFSGYSDMAIGLSLFFNIKIPLNFNSPYKATNMIDFWRRWHMTLSAFLRDYLYIPLGGNQKGKARRYLNLFITMLLGGLWHGAGWTFIAWGLLHGVYLIINHSFRYLCSLLGWQAGRFGRVGKLAGGIVTFASVVIAWVLFRANTFATASIMLRGMAGMHGLYFTSGHLFGISQINGQDALLLIGCGLAIVWLLPNTQEFMRVFLKTYSAYEKVAEPKGWAGRLMWRPAAWWTWTSAGVLLALSILLLSPAHVSEFLYFQF